MNFWQMKLFYEKYTCQIILLQWKYLNIHHQRVSWKNKPLKDQKIILLRNKEDGDNREENGNKIGKDISDESKFATEFAEIAKDIRNNKKITKK